MPRIIVSLTSYPVRYEAAAQALRTLLRQTVTPDLIQLWLDEDDVASVDDVPACLRELEESELVEIRWCPQNLRPHDKYFWTMQENPDDIIITVDDDIVYPLDLVQNLLQTHYRHPNAVVASRTNMPVLNDEGALAPYGAWVFEQTRFSCIPRFDLLPTGAGGVLYPPHMFDDEVFDVDAIRDCALTTDDLWLKVHELRLGIPVVYTGADPSLSYVAGTQEDGLSIENLERGHNDDVLKALFERYPSAEDTMLRDVRHREALGHEAQPTERPGVVRRALRRIARG